MNAQPIICLKNLEVKVCHQIHLLRDNPQGGAQNHCFCSLIMLTTQVYDTQLRRGGTVAVTLLNQVLLLNLGKFIKQFPSKLKSIILCSYYS